MTCASISRPLGRWALRFHPRSSSAPTTSSNDPRYSADPGVEHAAGPAGRGGRGSAPALSGRRRMRLIGTIFSLRARAVACTLILLGAPLVAEAQPAPKVYRIGYFAYLPCSDDPFLRDPFRQGLRDLGYVEGRNVVIECRSAEGKTERNPDLVAELVRLNVDVLLTQGTAMTLVAKQATKTIPIVMVYVSDPIASGIVT